MGIFDLGACEVARSLQARLAGSHGFQTNVIASFGFAKVHTL